MKTQICMIAAGPTGLLLGHALRMEGRRQTKCTVRGACRPRVNQLHVSLTVPSG